MHRSPYTPRDSEYAQALREAGKRFLARETTKAQYLAQCEHAAAVHDRMEERARFAMMLKREEDSSGTARTDARDSD